MIQELINSLAKTPDPIILENLPPPHVYDFHQIFHQIFMVHQIKMLPMDEDLEARIDKLIEKLTPEKLNRALNAFLMHLDKYKPNKYQLYFNLITALDLSRTTPFIANPGLEDIEGQRHPAPQRPLKAEIKKKQPTPINPDLKNLPSIALVKHYALVRKTSVFDFILEQSSSLNFSKVHDFIQHKNNYKLSSRGKVVYDGSFSWIARELGIHRNTVWNAFHWMAERKLVTKIAPQDHRKKKNSRWYVCTSMAQNLKLWSIAYQKEKG
jgi:hypothetical protein